MESTTARPPSHLATSANNTCDAPSDAKRRIKPSTVTHAQLANLFMNLGQVGTVTQTDKGKLYTYKDGWSDERVQELVGAPLAAIIIKRRESAGRLASEFKQKKMRAVERIEVLEATIQELSRRLKVVEERRS